MIDPSPLPPTRPSGHSLIAAAAVAFAASLWWFWPGIMTWDSRFQYRQAVLGAYDDWHPPIMAVLWHALLPVSAGGSALLVLHLAAYWAAFLLVALALARAGRTGLAWAALAVGLAPGPLLLSAFIHKDVGHAAALGLAFAIVLRHRAAGARIGWTAGAGVALLLFYGIMVRSNAMMGAASLIVYAVRPAGRTMARRALVAIVATAVLTVAAFPTASLVNRHIFRAAENNALASLVMFDLAGIAHFSRDPTVYPVRPPPLAVVDACYNPRKTDSLRDPGCEEWIGIGNGVKNKVKAVAWPRAILRHPLAYARHRLGHFDEELFALTGSRVWDWGSLDVGAYAAVPTSPIEGWALPATDRLADFPPTAPATAVVLGLAVLAILLTRTGPPGPWREAALYLGLSGLLYTGGYLLVGVAGMYRYQQYGMTTAPLSAVLLLAGTEPADRRRVIAGLAVPTLLAAAAIGVARLTLP